MVFRGLDGQFNNLFSLLAFIKGILSFQGIHVNSFWIESKKGIPKIVFDYLQFEYS